MKINIIKESFGPFRISATREVELTAKLENGSTVRDHYLSLGALYEMERGPSGKAEKLFWSARDAKTGKLVRGDFRRNTGIPATEEAARAIAAVMEGEGYSNVLVEIREALADGGKPTADDLKVAGDVIAKGREEKLGLATGASLQEVAVAYRNYRLGKERAAKAAAAAEFAD